MFRKEIERGLDILKKEFVDTYDFLHLRACGNWATKVFGVATEYEGKIYAPFYTGYMIFGRKAGGVPPFDPILKWVRCKGLANGLSEKEERRLVNAIRWKMARMGSRRWREKKPAPLVNMATNFAVLDRAFKPIFEKTTGEIYKYFAI